MLKGERCKSGKCPFNKADRAPAGKGDRSPAGKDKSFAAAPPGKDPRARPGKRSDYGLQLREKQKLKRIYGMLEKQFSLFFERARRMPGITGENLFVLLERRLDNVVYRLRFASSRSQARQLVLHGHIRVNGRQVNVPSYLVKPDDIIEIKEKSKNLVVIKEALKEFGKSGVMPWLKLDPDKMEGVFLASPRRGDITDLADIKEQMIIELYSK
jgi:small subunit ribosomal protein S4